jgi:hypothetical protein
VKNLKVVGTDISFETPEIYHSYFGPGGKYVQNKHRWSFKGAFNLAKIFGTLSDLAGDLSHSNAEFLPVQPDKWHQWAVVTGNSAIVDIKSDIFANATWVNSVKKHDTRMDFDWKFEFPEGDLLCTMIFDPNWNGWEFNEVTYEGKTYDLYDAPRGVAMNTISANNGWENGSSYTWTENDFDGKPYPFRITATLEQWYAGGPQCRIKFVADVQKAPK